MHKPTLDIVIVNWNSGTQLAECLASLAAATREVSIETVIVIDNGSSDASLGGIERVDLPLTVVRNTVNRGFASACNQGARKGRAAFVLFLNPDVRVFGNSLSVPLDFMCQADRQTVGIVGIQLVDAAGAVSASCARFPEPSTMICRTAGFDRLFPCRCPGHFLSAFDHRENRRVDQVMGAFFLVRRCLFERLGGFDERFFVYYEDLDFSLRAGQLGFSSWFVADAAAFHKGCGTTEAVKKERLFYYLRSRILYGFKHFHRCQALAVMGATLLVEPVSRLAFAVYRGSGKDMADIARVHVMLVKYLWAMRKARPGGHKAARR